MSDYHVGLEERLFAEPEQSYGAAEPPRGRQFLAREATFAVKEERRARKDRKNHRATEALIRGKRNVEWNVALSNAPAAGEGEVPGAAPPAFAPLYETSFQATATGAMRILGPEEGASAPTAMTAEALLLHGSGAPVAGALLALRTAAGWRVTAVAAAMATGAERYALTFSPSLPAPPLTGSLIGPALTYAPRETPQGSLTLHHALRQFDECAAGALPNRYRWTLSGGDEADLEVSGYAQDLARFGPLLLAEDVSAADTQWQVAAADLSMPGAGACCFLVDGRGQDSEVVAVTGVDQDDPTKLTVVRGLASHTASSHAAGATMTPCFPIVTPAGEAISGILGRVRVDDREFEVTRAQVTFEEHAKMRNRSYGSATARGYVCPEDREATVELDGFLVAGEPQWVKPGAMAPASVLLQAGDQPGRMHAIFLPHVLFEIPDLEIPPDAEAALKLSGRAVIDKRAPQQSEIVHAYL